MIIKVLGPGCSNCVKLYSEVQQAVAEANIEATVEKVSDIEQIMSYRVMSSPALVINETVVVAGRIPSRKEIAKLIADAAG